MPALADLWIDIGGFIVEVYAVRVEREPNGVTIRLSIDREGRALVVSTDEPRQLRADV